MVPSFRSSVAGLPIWAKRLGQSMAGVALSVALASCGDTSIGSSLLRLGQDPKPEDPNVAAKYAAMPTCPNADIRFGTETVSVFEPGKPSSAETLKFLISVQRVARDCEQIGENIIARVGVAGRVVAGPKGSTGKVDIPVRIAAVAGGKVLYTGLKTVSVQVEAPDFGANWSLVDEAVTIPANLTHDTIIYVGLDDKSKLVKPAGDKPSRPRVRSKPEPRQEADPYPQMKPNFNQR